MRKRIMTCLFFALALSLGLMLVLAACGGEQGGYASPLPASQQPDLSTLPSVSDPAVTVPALHPAQDSAPPTPSAPEIQLPPQGSPAPAFPEPAPSQSASPEPAQPLTLEQTYRAALEAIYNDYRYPNGDEVAAGDGYSMEDNDFAIFDVDGDGQEELIYQNDSSYMAGMVTTVYGFDCGTGMLYQELSGFVAMEFYDNGVVSIMASHNHGLSALEDFWPYALYQYVPGSDGYIMAGSLDAWDGALFPNGKDGVPFPADKDADGDHIIFTITSSGQEVITTYVDGPEYQEWVDSYLAGASRLELPWQSMTPEHIRAVSP